MKKQVNHTIRKHFNEVIYHTARYTEIFLSVLILVVIAKATIPLIHQLINTPVLDMEMEYFTAFLGQALSLVVGVEFVKMLCRHTAETMVEVLLFAIARQMVVEHLQTWQTLVGVVAIAILFAVRKYLLLKEDETTRHVDKL
ncbi:MAG: phosphate-starvation-inducible PsiE family protein [Eubacteriales bacterium]|nr:phosphate-starvation-inducible PsiE family protein [Eubacteriales bacterium]